MTRDRTGTIVYKGYVHFALQEHYGIELNDTSGDHDGKTHGIRYFECEAKKGVLVPQTQIVRKIAKRTRDETSPSPSPGPSQYALSPKSPLSFTSPLLLSLALHQHGKKVSIYSFCALSTHCNPLPTSVAYRPQPRTAHLCCSLSTHCHLLPTSVAYYQPTVMYTTHTLLLTTHQLSLLPTLCA